MMNATTKTCSYCGDAAHTARSCAIKRAGLPSPVLAAKEAAKAEKARIKAEKEAAIVAKRRSREAAKAEKARIKAENRSWRSRTARCSFCGYQGHSRTGCPVAKQYKTDVPAFIRTWRAYVWQKIKDLPLGVGTMVDYYGWGHYIGDDGTICHGRVRGAGDKQIIVGINLDSDPANPFSFRTQPIACLGVTDKWGDRIENTLGGFFPDGMFTGDYVHDNLRKYADHFDPDGLSHSAWVPRFQPSASGVTIGDSVDARVLEKWLNYSEEEFVAWLGFGKGHRSRWRRTQNDVINEFNYRRQPHINYPA